MICRLFLSTCAASLVLASLNAAPADNATMVQALSQSLTFYASYDGTTNATFAKGDPRIHTLLKPKPNFLAQPGIDTLDMTFLAPGKGLHGDALQFTRREARWLFYASEENVPFHKKNWSGTVSFWLSLDPEKDLAPGYCDPIQITPRAWNDASFFVDFDKEGDPRDFRLGAFADLKVWNPDGRKVDDIPETHRPLVKVQAPPFDRGKWTHVSFTWKKFNTDKKDGVATLYLDGKQRGEVRDWKQTFTWGPDEESRILIGLNYIGLFDELSCFDRALSADEIAYLSKQSEGLGKLLRKK